jgi:hypothetical protein
MNPLPGIKLEIEELAGAPVLQVVPAVGTVLTGVISMVLFAVTAVVEALCKVVVPVKNPAAAEPSAEGVDELEPTEPLANLAAVKRSVAVRSSVADKSPEVDTLPEESTDNWSAEPA